MDIRIENISKTYKTGLVEVLALNNINLYIERGEFLSIVGPSGSGKTTLLNIIGCIDKADKGILEIAGRNLMNLKSEQLAMFRNEYIGFIFQDFNLIPVLNVYENVEFALAIHPKIKRNYKERIMEILKSVHIEELANRFPKELSGGQKQRVAIARALVKKPILVLADEPTANLDSKNAIKVMELMRDMNEKYKTTFIFSTHDPLVVEFARRNVKLKDGTIEKDISV